MDSSMSVALAPPTEQRAKLSCYQNLNAAKREIRLVRFLGLDEGDQDQTISVAMTTASLYDEYLDYAALSYCWGDAGETEDLIVNGEKMRVRPGVIGLLRSVWHHLKVNETLEMPWPGLWLDIICINQADIPERNSQVTLMSEVFGRAKIVYAYLGASDGASRDFIAGYMTPNPSRYGSNLTMRLDTPGRHEELVTGLDTPADLPISVPGWLNGLENVTLRPYFSRMWIIQEMVFAQNLVLLDGENAMDWAAFIGAQRKAPKTIQRLSVNSGIQARLMAIDWLRQQISFGAGRTERLINLIQWFMQCRCRDPLDSVYALLNMSTDKGKITIEYRITPDQLWWDVFRRCFDQTQKSVGVYDQPANLTLMMALKDKMGIDQQRRVKSGSADRIRPDGTADLAVYSISRISHRTRVCISYRCWSRGYKADADEFCSCRDTKLHGRGRDSETWKLSQITIDTHFNYPWQAGKVLQRDKQQFYMISNCELVLSQLLIAIEPDNPIRFVAEHSHGVAPQGQSWRIVGTAWLIEDTAAMDHVCNHRVSLEILESVLPFRNKDSSSNNSNGNIHNLTGGLRSWDSWIDLRTLAQQDQQYELGRRPTYISIDFKTALENLRDDRPVTVWKNHKALGIPGPQPNINDNNKRSIPAFTGTSFNLPPPPAAPAPTVRTNNFGNTMGLPPTTGYDAIRSRQQQIMPPNHDSRGFSP